MTTLLIYTLHYKLYLIYFYYSKIIFDFYRTKIAEGLSTRTGKQCRERYHNHLQPNIRKGDWTEEEDRIIVEMQAKLGNQWAKITKMLPGRTDNAVKNRWHAAMRSQGRSSYGDKRRKDHNSTIQQSHPAVPVLPLCNLDRYDSHHHVNVHTDDLDYLYGADTEDETERDRVGRRGIHHSQVEHSLSGRTEPSHGIGSDTARQMEDMVDGGAFRSSPRLMDFLCFPLSGVTENAHVLLSGRSNSDGSLGVNVDVDGEYDCADTIAPLIASEGSPRDITTWLSATQNSPKVSDFYQDPFSKQCAYISSPGRKPYQIANTDGYSSKFSSVYQDGMNFSNLRKEKLMGLNDSNQRRRRRTKRVNSCQNSNNKLNKDTEMWAIKSSEYGINGHSSSFTSTSSHSSGHTSHENSDFDSQSSVSDDDFGELVDAGMIDFDESVLEVNTGSGSMSTDVDTEDPLAAFAKMEVSPRWELSPRLEYKRYRLDDCGASPLSDKNVNSFRFKFPEAENVLL